MRVPSGNAGAGGRVADTSSSTTKKTATAGGRSAKAIDGLGYLFDEGEKGSKQNGGGGSGEEKKTTTRRQRKAPAKERKKARRINYDLLSQPDGLPALYDRFKHGTFKIDESLPLVCCSPSPPPYLVHLFASLTSIRPETYHSLRVCVW
jgi:hypothetical protein